MPQKGNKRFLATFNPRSPRSEQPFSNALTADWCQANPFLSSPTLRPRYGHEGRRFVVIPGLDRRACAACEWRCVCFFHPPFRSRNRPSKSLLATSGNALICGFLATPFLRLSYRSSPLAAGRDHCTPERNDRPSFSIGQILHLVPAGFVASRCVSKGRESASSSCRGH